jgi:aspartate aminotransferase
MEDWLYGRPEEIISAMSNIQSQSTSNPTSISQKASVEALIGPQEEVKKMVSAFRGETILSIASMRSQESPVSNRWEPSMFFQIFPSITEGRIREEISNSLSWPTTS